MSGEVSITPGAPVTITVATVGPQGPKGERGEKGESGAGGPGVPEGGTAGQVLMKRDDEDFASMWANVPQPDAIDGGTF